jgi:hypothetical protein
LCILSREGPPLSRLQLRRDWSAASAVLTYRGNSFGKSTLFCKTPGGWGGVTTGLAARFRRDMRIVPRHNVKENLRVRIWK